MTPARLLAALAAAALLSACGSDSSSQPTGLSVTIEPTFAVANGNSFVTVTVNGSIQYPLSLSTTRGYWKNTTPPATTIVLQSVASAYLSSCDSHVNAGCAGVAEVHASDAKLADGIGNIRFDPY